MIEKIIYKNKLYSIIIRTSFKQEGIEFFTPNSFSQQLGYMNRPKGYKIPAHKHRLIPREVTLTQEVLFIKSGKVKVSFFDNQNEFLEQKILNSGDVILLAEGGHSFEMLEASEMIEVKQGPYNGDIDKVIFESN